jgi:hypothetical protein
VSPLLAYCRYCCCNRNYCCHRFWLTIRNTAGPASVTVFAVIVNAAATAFGSQSPMLLPPPLLLSPLLAYGLHCCYIESIAIAAAIVTAAVTASGLLSLLLLQSPLLLPPLLAYCSH